ncbi:MAG: MBL fold metallo-hydrolase [Acutalibacteraceae bacterium]|jgi:phosphoribosyl 1,2-cyclic phosphate phosphodiesterase
MKIKYFGTAAAEGFPGMFCKCEVCERARQAGGRNFRTRSQALIDGKLLIDFPPDTYMHVLYGGLDLAAVNSCIITHGHSDHLYASDLEMRKHGFAYNSEGKELPVFNLYATKGTADVIREFSDFEHLVDIETIALHEIKAFNKFTAEGYEITPFVAKHSKELDPVIYDISDGEKRLLYANDTAYFLDETWEYLEENKPFFNFVSLDCTGMLIDYPASHMGIESNIKVRNRLLELGCADESTIFCMHHFSHNGRLIYDELVPIAKEKGFIVSYDGLEVEF